MEKKLLNIFLGTHKYNMIYRVVFSLVAYLGCTQTLEPCMEFFGYCECTYGDSEPDLYVASKW